MSISSDFLFYSGVYNVPKNCQPDISTEIISDLLNVATSRQEERFCYGQYDTLGPTK